MIYEYATEKHTDSIFCLQNKIFKGECAYPRKYISSFVKNNSVIIAKNETDLLGFIIFGKARYEFDKNLKVNTIICLGVSSIARNQGIGHKLMTIVHTFDKQWFLHVKVNNEIAIKLYRSLGYIIVLTVKNYYPDEQLDGYYMRLDKKD